MKIKIIECPRDAMQGLDGFIPTDQKIEYINQLLKIGFDTIDFGSFVSHKAIPQLRDTAQVLEQLNWKDSKTKLLAIIANARGAEEASKHDAIYYLGFPLSISETFQQRNTNKSIEEALNTLEDIKTICEQSNKKLVTYLSMGFGNPYHDPYSVDMVGNFAEILVSIGAEIISLADTVGIATPNEIQFLTESLTKQHPAVEIGLHLHSNPVRALEKIEAAYRGGCKRFDGAIKGFGGCPMAEDDLVGNLATETIIKFLNDEGVALGLNENEFEKALVLADKIFPKA